MFEHDVKVMGIKPHTSHLIQVLDRNPFSAFKDAFNAECAQVQLQTWGKVSQEGRLLHSLQCGLGKSHD